MVKRTAHIIMALLILGTTTGFMLSRHYCAGNIVSIVVNKEAQPCCDGAATSGCCHNESHFYQLKVNYINFVSEVEFFDEDNSLFYPVDLTHIFSNRPADMTHDFRQPESPPPRDRNTFLSTYQSFLC